MKPTILFQKQLTDLTELTEAKHYFTTAFYRTEVRSQSLVIPRYSALPYYFDLEQDMRNLGSELINTYSDHLMVADLKNWYPVLEDFTPKTYFSLEEVPEIGQFVLKGATNSKKEFWSSMMLAVGKPEVVSTYLCLQRDGYIGYQNIYIREYTPLRKICDNICSTGCPISEEYRFFCLDSKILTGAFYWSGYEEEAINAGASVNNVPLGWLQTVVDLVRTELKIRFFVVDVACTDEGKWIVIELNDGCMSGLSSTNPTELYEKLSLALQ